METEVKVNTCRDMECPSFICWFARSLKLWPSLESSLGVMSDIRHLDS